MNANNVAWVQYVLSICNAPRDSRDSGKTWLVVQSGTALWAPMPRIVCSFGFKRDPLRPVTFLLCVPAVSASQRPVSVVIAVIARHSRSPADCEEGAGPHTT